MLFLRFYLWIVPNILSAFCLVGLLRRRLYRRYPILCGYLAADLGFSIIATSVWLLLLWSMSILADYRSVLVVETVITSTFAVGVLFEVGNELILSHSSLVIPARRLARWSTAVLILVAVGCSALLRQSGIDREMAIFQIVDFSGSVVAIGLLAALVLFTRALRISWRSLPAGIVLGFGIYASAQLSASLLVSGLGRPAYVSGDLVRLSGFHICTVIWLLYIYLPEHSRPFTGSGLPKADLEFWDQELQRMVRHDDSADGNHDRLARPVDNRPVVDACELKASEP
jgi:hypothetical protein